MIWSRYNYLCKSPEQRCFLYNSRTNALLKVDEDFYNQLSEIKDNKEKTTSIDELLDAEVLDAFKKAKIVVDRYEDDNFISQKKYLRYHRSFSEKVLGIVVVPTYGCNFKCPYCYETELPSNVMSSKIQDQLIEFIKSFDKAEEIHFSWHGGEPLLAFNRIKEILFKIRKAGLKLARHNLVTNGFLLDKEKCHFFNEFNLSTVQITIDGLKDSHNMSRIHKAGIPTYDIILNNIDNLFEIIPDCNVIVRVNIHKENQDDFVQLCNELNQRWEGKKYSISMNYANDHGNGCKVECFKNKEKIFFTEKIIKQHNLKNVSLYPEPQLSGCTASFNNAYVVGVNGELYKCWVDVGKEERIVGNIFENQKDYSLISEYVVGTDMFSDPKCLNCTFLPICNGGCGLRRLDYKKTGKKYDLCPIDTKDFGKLLDLVYLLKFDSN